MRLVLDTNVVVSAFRSPRGASAALVVAGRRREITLLASGALMFEYEAVLTRPEHIEAAGATIPDAIRFIDALATFLTPVRVAYLWRPQVKDPDDDMVLEAAINGRADALITMETKTFAPAARRFGLGVMTPAAIWSRLQA